MAFERFIPSKASNARPQVTVRPSGLISFDAVAVDAFGLDRAKVAMLFFDKARKMVGIQLSAKGDDEAAFKLTHRHRSVSLKAPQFFERYGLVFPKPQRFGIDRDAPGDMLTISMKNVHRRRGRPRKRS